MESGSRRRDIMQSRLKRSWMAWHTGAHPRQGNSDQHMYITTAAGIPPHIVPSLHVSQVRQTRDLRIPSLPHINDLIQPSDESLYPGSGNTKGQLILTSMVQAYLVSLRFQVNAFCLELEENAVSQSTHSSIERQTTIRGLVVPLHQVDLCLQEA